MGEHEHIEKWEVARFSCSLCKTIYPTILNAERCYDGHVQAAKILKELDKGEPVFVEENGGSIYLLTRRAQEEDGFKLTSQRDNSMFLRGTLDPLWRNYRLIEVDRRTKSSYFYGLLHSLEIKSTQCENSLKREQARFDAFKLKKEKIHEILETCKAEN